MYQNKIAEKERERERMEQFDILVFCIFAPIFSQFFSAKTKV
jgi:hypothetical protein